jgi:hypothetical protein
VVQLVGPQVHRCMEVSPFGQAWTSCGAATLGAVWVDWTAVWGAMEVVWEDWEVVQEGWEVV